MRSFLTALPALALAFALASGRANPSQEINSRNANRITPVLRVKDIEPIVPFWVDRLGFAKTIKVPDGNKLGFVAFQKGTAEVMYQTYASVEKDAPSSMSAQARKGPTYLYMEVDNLVALLAAMKVAKIDKLVLTAFYGMSELRVKYVWVDV